MLERRVWNLIFRVVGEGAVSGAVDSSCVHQCGVRVGEPVRVVHDPLPPLQCSAAGSGAGSARQDWVRRTATAALMADLEELVSDIGVYVAYELAEIDALPSPVSRPAARKGRARSHFRATI